MRTYWRYLDWDIAKIVLGVMLALVSYEFIDTVNSLAEEYEEGHSLWGDFLKYLADADRESDWLKFEPIAILIAFSARPLSKLLVSPFLFLFGPFIADAVKALSLRPRAYIEAELSQEQREKVSEWLQEFER